jgi:uncharacterized protein YidB (DUF937 family)
MGILDTVLSSVMGSGANSPFGGVLGQILGGGGQGAGPTGDLGGLLGQLRQAGLGSHVDSWVGTGGNAPVSPAQLNDAFGERQVNSWAGQAGMQPGDFLSRLSQHLPSAVDRLTPDGRVPDEGTASV